VERPGIVAEFPAGPLLVRLALPAARCRHPAERSHHAKDRSMEIPY
jgi:hypothetical protein